MASYTLEGDSDKDREEETRESSSSRKLPAPDAGYSLDGGSSGAATGGSLASGGKGFPATVEKAISIYPVLGWSPYTLLVCTVDDRTREASETVFEAYRQCPSASLKQHTHVHNLATGERLPPFLRTVPVVFVRENGGLISTVDHICEFFARFEPRLLHGAILASAKRSGGGAASHTRRRGHMLTVLGGIREGDKEKDREVVSSNEKRMFGGSEATADGGRRPARRVIRPSEDTHAAATHRKWVKDGGGGGPAGKSGGGSNVGAFDSGFGL